MRWPFLSALVLTAGCSALVNPDDSLLGDDDAAVGVDASTSDAGVPRDGAAPDGGACAAGCDDGIPCTEDRCEADRCVHTPDDDACEGDLRCSPVLGCVPLRCSTDEECDDAVFCNGAERCDPATEGTGCVPGPPAVCNDGLGCTDDRCDPTADACTYEPADRCADDFDCTADVCDPERATDETGCVHETRDDLCAVGYCFTGGTCDAEEGCVGGAARDCGDGDPCTADVCDAVGMRCDHAPLDADMDGVSAESVAMGDADVLCGGEDCDDHDPTAYPDAPEVCDGVDNNCDGSIDEGCGDAPDDCDRARRIELGSDGRGSVTGRFAPLGDDFAPNPVLCTVPPGGRDAVYYVDIPAGISDVEIDTIGSTVDTVLSVAFECPPSAVGSVCNDDFDRAEGDASRIWIHRVASFSTTRVFLIVDTTTSSASGAYTVNVARRGAAGDSCPSFAGSPLDISAGGTVVGVVSGTFGSQRGSCQSSTDFGTEAVFATRSPASGTMTLRAYSTEFVPDLYVRNGSCGSGAELGCVVGSSAGGVSSASLTVAAPTATRNNFVFVEGTGSYALYYEPY